MSDQRRRRPQGQDRNACQERVRPQHPDQKEADECDYRARDHLAQELPRACLPRRAGPSGRAGGGRLPLQQAPLGRPETDEGQGDRVDPFVSLAGQEGHLERYLGEGGLPVFPHGAEEDAPRLLWPGARGYLQKQGIYGKGDDGQDGGRPDRRASGEERPGQQ